VRLPFELKEEFKKALQKNDAVQSNVLRRCIREYIKKNK
jgi:metal-responsive CopG/Arc/MetJ family transcriptional regulator